MSACINLWFAWFVVGLYSNYWAQITWLVGEVVMVQNLSRLFCHFVSTQSVTFAISRNYYLPVANLKQPKQITISDCNVAEILRYQNHSFFSSMISPVYRKLGNVPNEKYVYLVILRVGWNKLEMMTKNTDTIFHITVKSVLFKCLNKKIVWDYAVSGLSTRVIESPPVRSAQFFLCGPFYYSTLIKTRL